MVCQCSPHEFKLSTHVCGLTEIFVDIPLISRSVSLLEDYITNQEKFEDVEAVAFLKREKKFFNGTQLLRVGGYIIDVQKLLRTCRCFGVHEEHLGQSQSPPQLEQEFETAVRSFAHTECPLEKQRSQVNEATETDVFNAATQATNSSHDFGLV